MLNGAGRAYFDTAIAKGRTRNEAMRCLKRRLANHLWRLMVTDEQHILANRHDREIPA